MESWFLRVYKSGVIDRPAISLALVFCLAVLFSTQIEHFKLDASAESIVLENDQDLKKRMSELPQKSTNSIMN